MTYVDAHCHLADPRFSNTEVSEILSSSVALGIHFFLQGGVSPLDWQRQQELSVQFPKKIGLCFGLHPYFVSGSSNDECESALELLSKKIAYAHAIGETGLDFRKQYAPTDQDEAKQIEYFEAHVALARMVSKPLVLHIVKAHEPAIRALSIWDLPTLPGKLNGIIHAFNGSYEVAKKYLDLGFMISVGGALTHPRNQDLRDCVKKLPLDLFLIESDSPDQKPRDWSMVHNQSSSIFRVADELSKLRGAETGIELLMQAADNLKRLGFLYTSD